MRDIISRFAPALTGFLHLGHVLNAVFVWGVARACGGRVLLRIEDHDRKRSRPLFERAILEDLEWLGFVADEPVVRQSERHDIYTAALEALRRQGLVYGCSCTRGDIAELNEARPVHGEPRLQPDDEEPRYAGTCRDRGLAETSAVGLRVRLDASVECFVDLRHGPQTQRPFEQCGDLLVRDRDGNWTYQFAAAVDDFAQAVTLVVRGDDLLPSTGRQIQLARLLGRPASPLFLHHGLVMKTPTQKLSKSDGDTGIRDMRARGWSPARVIGEACSRAGLIAEPREVVFDELSSMMSAFKEVGL
jgi:glutamyl/glutaminyl-tRNA synthetase